MQHYSNKLFLSKIRNVFIYKINKNLAQNLFQKHFQIIKIKLKKNFKTR